MTTEQSGGNNEMCLQKAIECNKPLAGNEGELVVVYGNGGVRLQCKIAECVLTQTLMPSGDNVLRPEGSPGTPAVPVSQICAELQ